MEIFLTQWNFTAGRSISELKFVYEQPILRSQCSGSKKIAKSIDELVTSRSITGRPYFPDFDMLDAMIASALKKLLSTRSQTSRKE